MQNISSVERNTDILQFIDINIAACLPNLDNHLTYQLVGIMNNIHIIMIIYICIMKHKP